MSTIADRTSASPRTRAGLTFMVKTEWKPYIETEALTGAKEPRYHAETEMRDVEIHDGRPAARELSLDRNGFQLLESPTSAADLYDDAEVRAAYYPDVEALIKRLTGASRVIVFDHTRRTDAEERSGIRGPARRVHNDYTEQSGPQRMREILPPGEAGALQGMHFKQINLWRPIRGPVLRSPIAVLDAESLAAEDLIGTDMLYPDRTGEIYHLAFNPDQRWFYFPEMRREEALLIKGYDSRADAAARFTPHTAFDHPGTTPDTPPRESIEVRTMAFFEDNLLRDHN